MRTAKDYIILIVKGIGMGAADVVPGVSGGTIALITNIYEELIESLKSFDTDAFTFVKSFDLKGLWKHINGNFLAAVLFGILISIFSLANIIHHLLETSPIQLWSFFFGLVLISALWVLNRIKGWNYKVVLATVIGIVIAYLITSASPATTPDNLLFVFLSGMIAICAMILPGVSGSFILLILGKFQFIISSVKNFDITVILIFVAGCAVGLLSFVRVVAWFLKKFHDLTVAVLAGFMIGSLNKIWPWKEVLSYRTSSDGEQTPLIEQNIWPGEYVEKVGADPKILSAILFFALGLLIVVLLEKIAKYIAESKKYA